MVEAKSMHAPPSTQNNPTRHIANDEIRCVSDLGLSA